MEFEEDTSGREVEDSLGFNPISGINKAFESLTGQDGGNLQDNGGRGFGIPLIRDALPILQRATTEVVLSEYRCTTRRGVYPSPTRIIPDITEVCRDFKGQEMCLEQKPEDAQDLDWSGSSDGWIPLPRDHDYYKVSISV